MLVFGNSVSLVCRLLPSFCKELGRRLGMRQLLHKEKLYSTLSVSFISTEKGCPSKWYVMLGKSPILHSRASVELLCGCELSWRSIASAIVFTTLVTITILRSYSEDNKDLMRLQYNIWLMTQTIGVYVSG